MKPETRFKRAVIKLAKSFNLDVEVYEYMAGADSRTREAWVTFGMKTQATQLPVEFIQKLEDLNSEVVNVTHSLSGLAMKARYAVRQVSLAGQHFLLRNALLSAAS